MHRSAFSLLELLVVIGVIALLAVLAVPAFSRARLQLWDTVCRSHLHQWGLGTFQYAAENQDFLPKDGALGGQSMNEGWYVELPRVMGIPAYHTHAWRTNAAVHPGRTLWLCPRNARRSNSRNLFHYCLNREINGTGGGQQVALGSIATPTCAPWLFDNGRLAPVGNWNWVHTNLHGSGAHFLFLDGHVTRFPSIAYWNFQSNRGRLDNPDLRWRPGQP